MIIKNNIPSNFYGCDAVVKLPSERKDTEIKILQITDMQFINSEACRQSDRLRIDEINAWKREFFDAQAGNHIRSLIAQAKPDLIFITGDIVYGEFDDSGESFDWFCDFMDSFKIPWAPVYGNHDNESKKGVDWQNQRFEDSEFCLFKRGSVSGNGNYVVGVAVDDTLIRALYMIDSNGCGHATDEKVIRHQGIFPDQLQFFKDRASIIEKTCKKPIPAFTAFHIPPVDFYEIEKKKGYCVEKTDCYTLGVTVEAKDGDFGFKQERSSGLVVDGFYDFVKTANVDGVFVGHCHSINTVIHYDDITWVFGLKTGQYDYHTAGNTGGTLITLKGNEFDVNHIPSLTVFAPYPKKAPMFREFFSKEEE